MTKKNKVVLGIYFSIIFSFCLVFSGIIEFIPICEYYTNSNIVNIKFFVPIIFFPIVGYLINRYLKIEKSNRFFFYLLIPIASWLIVSFISYFNAKNVLRSSVCIVRTATIKDTYASNQTNYVDVIFRRGDHRYKRNGVRFLGKGVASTLHIGDSLLVISVKDCDAIMYVYKARPTTEEFLKCKDYGYFYDGKLYSKEEFEKK